MLHINIIVKTFELEIGLLNRREGRAAIQVVDNLFYNILNTAIHCVFYFTAGQETNNITQMKHSHCLSSYTCSIRWCFRCR